MPVYEYMCDDCGPFETLRAMAQRAEPSECPDCGTLSPRVVLTAPRLSAMSAERRSAFARNEKSAHEPRVSNKDSRAQGHVHSASCGCGAKATSGRGRGRTAKGKDGSKSFPSARPWMISH